VNIKPGFLKVQQKFGACCSISLYLDTRRLLAYTHTLLKKILKKSGTHEIRKFLLLS
jgi:hypothetical protein